MEEMNRETQQEAVQATEQADQQASAASETQAKEQTAASPGKPAAGQQPAEEATEGQASVSPEKSAPERSAEEKITVTMTPQYLYDFTLYHTFSKLSGFLVNIFAVAIAFMGLLMKFTGRASGRDMILYFCAAIFCLGYTPVLLKIRAKRQVRDIDEYRYPNEYTFNRTGVHTSYNGTTVDYAWDRFERIIATPKTIGFYYGKDQALVIPKEQFGNRFSPILNMAARNCKPFTVRIR